MQNTHDLLVGTLSIGQPADAHGKKPQGGKPHAEATPERGRTLAARQANDHGKAMPRQRRSLNTIAPIRRRDCDEADAPSVARAKIKLSGGV